MLQISKKSLMRGLKIEKYILFLMLFTITISSSLVAQRTISGTVVDTESGEPLIGATVFDREDQSRGTITDFDGNFTLEISDDAQVLVVRYVGFESLELRITEEDFYLIRLSSGRTFDEVVIIGYGTVEREDVTGSIQTVSSSDFNQGAITSAQELLSGKVPGVNITTGGGGPDEGAQILIRGRSSLDATNDPLIVVDGVPLATGGISGNRNPLNVVNPQDIESITVLKDASATAIYGSRASGGVILITTKRGSVGQPLTINYNANVSFGSHYNKVDVLSASEFREVMAEQHPDHVDLMGTNNIDWQDEIYRTAVGTDHNLNFTGSAMEIIPYRVSLGYTYKEGILLTDQFQRYTAGLNVSPQFLENRLQVNLGARGMFTKNQFAERGAIGAALSFDPTQDIMDPESKFSGYTVWTDTDGNPNGLAPTNPISLLDRRLRQDDSEVTRYILNASADYRFSFLPSLRANLNLGYDYSKGEGGVNILGENQVAYAFDAVFGGGVKNTYEEERKNSLLEFYLNYRETFGQHRLDAMAGYSWQHFYDENSFFRSDVAGTEDFIIDQRGLARELYLLSVFGRVNYVFDDRLLLTFTLRADATSRFAPENRWGYFPALATAYRIIDNDNYYFSNLRLRAGWGITGQQDIGGYYIYQAVYEASLDNARYRLGDEFITTLRPNGYDRNIKWEETQTYNIGLDFDIIENRLSGSLDLYRRLTEDLLGFVDVPAGTNLTNRVFTNVGSMESDGFELSLMTSPLYTQNIRWDLAANFAYNKSTITGLTATDDEDFPGIPVGGISGGVGSLIQLHNVGNEPSSFYVLEQVYDEDGRLIEGEFVDRNMDGTVGLADRYIFKRPDPRWTIGITNNFNYQNWDFSFAGRAHFGNYIYNNVATNLGNYNLMYHPTNYLVNIHRSAVENDIKDQSSVTFSDHFVTNGAFFRMDHITLGYTFNNLVVDNLRVYATVQNAFVITGYDGLDPEIPGGIDNNFYPRPRTILMGVSLTF